MVAAGATVEDGGKPWTALLHPHHHEAEQGHTRARQQRRQQGEEGRPEWWVKGGRSGGRGRVAGEERKELVGGA